jgi:hypothetical protein
VLFTPEERAALEVERESLEKRLREDAVRQTTSSLASSRPLSDLAVVAQDSGSAPTPELSSPVLTSPPSTTEAEGSTATAAPTFATQIAEIDERVSSKRPRLHIAELSLTSHLFARSSRTMSARAR